jgi:hypothetical protein
VPEGSDRATTKEAAVVPVPFIVQLSFIVSEGVRECGNVEVRE